MQHRSNSPNDSDDGWGCLNAFCLPPLDLAPPMSLRSLFLVQSEGRGHMTQALALRRLLQDAGHQVVHVVMGHRRDRPAPRFFAEKIDAPITHIKTPNFVSDANQRSVRPWKTLIREVARIPVFLRSLRTIDRLVKAYQPDVIVNFFEPTGGVYGLWRGGQIPIVCVAHQYMFHHPAYRFPPDRWMPGWAARTFAHLTALGATRKVALSLYPAPDRLHEGIVVLPPLLRKPVFDLPLDRTEPFYLVYILNSGYAEAVLDWHHAHPEVRLHCFWDRPDADPVEAYDHTLTFHQLHDETFLQLMARCRGLVSTAGFESIAEAMYLGKPVQVIPVDGHFEQWCNAFDTVRAGAGIRSDRFDIGRLQHFVPQYDHDAAAFRAWLHEARHRFVREIEHSAGRPAPSPSIAVPV